MFFIGCANKKNIETKPLIVFLHGYGDNENHFKAFSEQFEDDFETKLVRGFFDMKNNHYSFGKLNYNENKNTWFDKKDGLYSVFKLKEILKAESKDIIIVGVSQGATLGYAMVLNYPERFKRLVAINGYIDQNLLIDRYQLRYDSLDILRFNGSNDYLINQKMTDFSTNYLDSLNIENTFIEHTNEHSYTDDDLNIIKEWIFKTTNK